MNEENTIYTLNEHCIANELSIQGSPRQRLLVPHLSVLNGVREELSGKIDNLSTSMDGKIAGMSCQFQTGFGEIISSITQENGKVEVGKRQITTDDVSAVSLIPDDFCSEFSERRIYFNYEDRKILLGKASDVDEKSKMLSIDCNDFIKDGMLLSVTNGFDQSQGPFIDLVFNTDAGKEPIRLWAREVFKQFYTGFGVVKVNEQFQISVDIDQLRNEIDYNNLYDYYQFLAGLGEWHDIGAIGKMSADISTLFQMGNKDLKLIGHIIPNEENFAQKDVAQFLSEQLECTDKFPNGSFITVGVMDNKKVVVSRDGLSVGNGDIIILHSHGDEPYINVEDINLTNGTLYLLKAGVSRYEYEKNVDDIACISDWIDANFTGFPDKDQELIETKKNVVIDNSLSVENLSSKSGIINDLTSDNSIITNLSSDNSIISNAYVVNLTSDYSNLSDIHNVNLTSVNSYLENSQITALTASSAVIETESVSSSYISNLTAENGNVTNLCAESSKLSSVEITSLTATSAFVGVLSAHEISVDILSAMNLNYEKVDLSVEGNEVVSVITSISETNGIISVCCSQLEQSMVNQLTGTITYLSDAISSKIFIVNEDVGLSGHSDLSVVKISKDDYEELVSLSACDDRTIYIVYSNIVDVYGQRVVNVADAEDLSDAVNFGQMTSGLEQVSGNIMFLPGEVDGSSKLRVGQYSLSPSITTENIASAYAAVSEGAGTSSLGIGSHAEGIGSLAIGYASHVEGADNINGKSVPDDGDELLYPIAEGYASHAEGVGYAKGDYSHAEGGGNEILTGDWQNHPTRPTAEGKYSHAEGTHTWAKGDNSHAEGDTTLAAGRHSHAECGENKSIGDYSHTEGKKNIANGNISHAEGNGTKADGECSHAEGKSTTASANYSHAEGQGTKTSGTFSHAEGYQSETGNLNPGGDSEGAHAEGYQTKANGDGAHSEGRETTASGIGAHSEGYKTNADGVGAHSEGRETAANGICAHSEGYKTNAFNKYEHAQGTFNESHKSESEQLSAENTIHSIGIGQGENSRKNAVEVMQNGDVYVVSVGGYDGSNLSGNTLQQTISNISGYVTDANKWISCNFSNAFDSPNTILKKDALLGTNISVSNGITSNVLENGDNCIASGKFSHAEGSNTFALSTASHAEGGGTVAKQLASHAEGVYTQTNGVGSHSEGVGIPFIAGTTINIISGCANGPASHVEGIGNVANAFGSHVDGVCATDGGNPYSFVWQGINLGPGGVLTNTDICALTTPEKETEFNAALAKAGGLIANTTEYVSHGYGTFNIKPAATVGNDPATGFFIGDESLADRLSSLQNNVMTSKPLSGYYIEHNLSSCNWRGLELNQLGEMLSVIFNTFGRVD